MSVSLATEECDAMHTATNIQNSSTEMGSSHEDVAWEEFMELSQQQHKSFECHIARLVNLEHPHLGASPGGVILCACCGTGLLESKCPCKHRDTYCVTDPSFYLHQVSGTVVLKTTRDYYVQIHGQMAICKKYIIIGRVGVSPPSRYAGADFYIYISICHAAMMVPGGPRATCKRKAGSITSGYLVKRVKTG